MRALGRAIAALARVVIAPLIPLPLRSRRPRLGTSAPPDVAAPPVVPPCGPAAVRTSQFPGQLTLAEVEIVEVEPDFSEQLYATVFELLQLGPRSKLLDLRAARVIPPALFECLATAWRVPPDIVPRLGILLDYERWTVLRNVAARRLQPLIDHGVAVEMFYVQQVDTLPGWFAGGDVRHDHLRDVINTTASGWSRAVLTSTRRVARWAAGQPAGDGARDREPHGGEAVGKVALRPRTTARRCPTSLWPRGGNAAHVRR